jgi:hypothetical protein
MRHLASTATLVVALALCAVGSAVPRVALATPSRDACTGFLSMPAGGSNPGVVLDQPGTWCLDHDLTYDGVLYGANYYMVRVLADDVTIDCRGHRLVFAGQLENYYYSHAIIADDGPLRTTVRNCRIDNFSYGIFLGYVSEYATQAYLVEDNVVTGNGLDHADFGGSVVAIYGFRDGTIRRNRVTGSAGWGIFAGNGARVTDNVVDGLEDVNGSPAVGIMLYQPRESLVHGNVVRGLRHNLDIAAQPLYGMQVDAVYGLKVHMDVRDNVLVGDAAAGTVAFDCTAGAARLADNIVSGFQAFHTGCTDLGDNDVSP